MKKPAKKKEKYAQALLALFRFDGVKLQTGGRQKCVWSDWYFNLERVEAKLAQIKANLSTTDKKGKKKVIKKKEKVIKETKELRKIKKPQKAPLKTPNAYMLFCQKRHPEIKIQNPSIKPSEIIKLIADEWRSLDESTKEGYKKLYTTMKDKFENCKSKEC